MFKPEIRKVIAIIRPEALNDVKIALEKIGIRGMNAWEVQGCGLQYGWSNPGNDKLKLLTKIRLEMVVDSKLVDTIVNEIISVTRTGNVGDGKIFIEPVLDVIRIRTGKKGKEAL